MVKKGLKNSNATLIILTSVFAWAFVTEAVYLDFNTNTLLVDSLIVLFALSNLIRALAVATTIISDDFDIHPRNLYNPAASFFLLLLSLISLVEVQEFTVQYIIISECSIIFTSLTASLFAR